MPSLHILIITLKDSELAQFVGCWNFVERIIDRHGSFGSVVAFPKPKPCEMQSAGSEWSKKWDLSCRSSDSEDSEDSDSRLSRLFTIDWFGFWLYHHGTTLLQIRGQFADGEAYGSSPLCHFPCMAQKRGGETGGPSTDRCPLDGFSRGDLEPRLRCWSLPSFDPRGLFGRRRTNPASHSMVCPQGPRGHSLCHHHRRCCKQRFHGTGSSSRMGPFFPTDVVLDLSQSRHQVPSITGQKALILRDLRPMARILLVDDSLREDPIPTWILRRSQVKFVALPYEGTGLNLQRCADVDAELLSWSSKNPNSALAAHCRSLNQLGWWWPRGRVWHTRAQVAFFALNSATWPVLVKVVCESKVHQSWFCGKCLQKKCSSCVMGNDITANGNEKSNAITWKLNIKGTSGDVLNVLVFTSPVPVSSVSSQSQRLQLRVLLKLSIILLAGSMVEIILEHAPRPVQDMLFNTG